MILEGKTVLVTGVGNGLGRECAASALRDGANVVLAARTAETLTAIAGELDPSGERVATHPTDITDPESCAVAGRVGPGPVRVGRRPDPGGGVRERLGRPLRPQVRGLAQGVRDQRARRPHRDPAGGRGHEGRRGRLGGAHRIAVDVPAGAAPERLRGVQERAAVGHVLPGRRARSRQHPLQHGHPVVDVGAERRDVRERDGRPARAGPRTTSSTTSSASSRSAG